jgi:hypothetical protein
MTEPLVLSPVDAPKSWGHELWLNSTRPEAGAGVVGAGTLADVLAARPELLGERSRLLFGDQQPIFTKLIHTDFPPLVHVGFNRAVERATLLGWLEREQAELRALFAALALDSRDALARFAAIYGAWANTQALARWRHDDEADLAARLLPLVRDGRAALPALVERLRALRLNRAAFVETLNELDLRREQGNLLLIGAGMVHAIFGLSHQTHPLDRARAALEALLATLPPDATAAQLRAHVDAAGLAALRAEQPAAPKNEAWLPLVLDGKLTLVEPQQTSDTTYSLADFYTPFVWQGERARFRKGDPLRGLGADELGAILDGMSLAATPVDELRRAPVRVSDAGGVAVSRLVDEPARWPFFTAYRVELAGRAGAPVTWQHDDAGAFQQLVILDGEVQLEAGARGRTLHRRAPAFVPAGARCRVTASAPASLLVFSIPGPRPRG